MMKTKVGLYVHIPFCIKKCNYCDFCSFSDVKQDTRKRYIDRLCQEIESYSKRNIEIDTIFFGGGTPSVLTIEEFDRIVDSIENTFIIDSKKEFTVEVNPGAADIIKIQAFVRRGVNRFSVGLQSIHDNEMKKLGRIHDFEDFKRTYNDIRSAGITNINIDLMYGIPEQTLKSFETTLDRVLDLDPEHISVYGLILEENTPFYAMRETLDIPSEDAECDMYYLALNKLSQKGYCHYEISNYSKKGFESRHNLKYWHCDQYIGIGVSAHSYFEGSRYGNKSNLEKYIADISTVETLETLDSETNKYEFAMLSLRLSEGFSFNDYKNRFGCDFLDGRAPMIHTMVEHGYIKMQGDRISLTDKGFYVSNSILTELL